MECYHTQIVDREGTYNVDGVRNFATATNLSDSGHSYCVVAIIGPQHGGKSTIMNRLFGTNFKQMDTFRRRKKTTEGIWIAKCVGIDNRFIIAMDMEGTDGRERGADDTAFEKQSALFALAIADVVMINMWCNDLGREHAANKPMLKVVFEVMMRMFSPRKVTLLFVLRDKTQTPFEYLKADVEEETQQIWETVAECHPNGNQDFNQYFDVMMRMFSPRKVTILFVLRDKTQAERFDNLKADVEKEIQEIWDTAAKRNSSDKYDFGKYFRVEVVALSNYHDKKELFVEEVAQMRNRYFGSNLLERDGNMHDRLPASEFAFSTKQIWSDIKQNKDLDIPAHKVMVETFRCKEIADDKFGVLSSDKGWLELKKAVLAGPVPVFANFRSKALEDLKKLFGDYSYKRIEFGAAIRTRLLDLDEACKDAAMELVEWDTSDARENLHSDIERQLIQLHDSKLSELATVAKDKLAKTLSKIIEANVEDGAEKMWELIRECLVKNTEQAVTEFEAEIVHLGSSQALINLQIKNLRQHAKNVAEQTVQKIAEDIQLHMEIWFERVFTRNDDGRKKYWTKVADIDNLILEARKESLKILADVAALRFSGQTDNIHDQLFSALIDGSADGTEGERVMEFDPLACKKWANLFRVSSSDTLITPEECKRIWAEFINKPNYIVYQAKDKRREYERKKESLRQLGVAVGSAVTGVVGAVAGVVSAVLDF